MGLALAGSPFALVARADEPALARIAFQLGWIKNFQFAGDYIADHNKYYQKFGLRVDLLAGGPTISAPPIVTAGKALIGETMVDSMATANAHGASLKCIGATYQRNVSAIISLAKSPLTTPADMIGRKIGLQIVNLNIWRAFLRINKIDPRDIKTVPVQSDFSPLISGEVDGFFGEVIDDAVQLRRRGHEIQTLLLADFGYRMLAAVYVVAADSLHDTMKRAQIVAFMRGDIMGWHEAIRNPTLGAALAVNIYGTENGLDLQSQQASCEVASNFMVGPATQEHGLFWMTPTAIRESITSLAAAGVRATPEMFTNEILEKIYGGKNLV
jgi:ABC-type nitrate/sulfonate/bicarbonate transport system substrate-binding protein